MSHFFFRFIITIFFLYYYYYYFFRIFNFSSDFSVDSWIVCLTLFLIFLSDILRCWWCPCLLIIFSSFTSHQELIKYSWIISRLNLFHLSLFLFSAPFISQRLTFHQTFILLLNIALDWFVSRLFPPPSPRPPPLPGFS